VFDARHRLTDVVDWKFGIYVVPADALQLAIYAMLAAAVFGVAPDGVTAWIVQPRALHLHGSARGARYTAADLVAVERHVRAAAARTAASGAPRRAGEWCTFCRAAATCETRQQAAAQRPRSRFFQGES
jgi:hypothetical protein